VVGRQGGGEERSGTPTAAKNRNFKVISKKMKIFFLCVMAIVPVLTWGQRVTYSDFDKDDNRDIAFEIIGKMNGNILVYKNVHHWQHRITILGADMKIKKTVNMDFVPEKAFNADFVLYPDFFYMIYQYQKKNTLHCMAVKMDGNAQKINEPIEIDTTQILFLATNKIYSTIYSEDKQKLMLFKMPKKNNKYSIVTMLFNADLKLIAKHRELLALEELKDHFDNFSLDNEGNLVFTKDSKKGYRDNSNFLEMGIKEPASDTISFQTISLDKHYIDEVKLKIDNLNKRYFLNSFYYKKSRGNIEGLLNYIWNKAENKIFMSAFTPIGDSIRDEARISGQLRSALDDFFIRQVFAKKDGGFLLTAEDYSTQSRGVNNSWSRWDYLNSYYYNPSSYYYNPYSDFYRPINSYASQSTRFYYTNILIMGFDKSGQLQWSKVIQKDQHDDDEDNFMSFSTFKSGDEIHFLFNVDKNKNQILANYSITGNGQLTHSTTLKSMERGYEFMPRLSKQIGTSQLIIPCMHKGYICFAKIDL
jgi:hypothetical protein